MSSAPETTTAEPASNINTWTSLWRTIRRFEKEKVHASMALRNALGVVLPLIVAAAAASSAAAGLTASIGALNVSFSDGNDPYPQRARRMLTSSAVVGFAVFCGAMCARDHYLAVIVVTIWAFAAGMLVALGNTPADIGTISLVTLVVFSAQSMSPERAALSGILALAGGLLQTCLALALWPVRRYELERQALGSLYQELAGSVASTIRASEAPPASAASSDAQQALAMLARNHSLQGQRYLALLGQAERIRLTVLGLVRLRNRISRESAAEHETDVLDASFSLISEVLESIANSLLSGSPATSEQDRMDRLGKCSQSLRRRSDASPRSAMAKDARMHIDALSGQLRSALELAGNASPAGGEKFARLEGKRPWTLRLVGSFATLRANLTLDSAACRHAVRLAGCLAIGEALGRAMQWQRFYWLPMTIAIILKPDFTATFSRGVLRLAGTFAGLLVATVLFHLLAPATGADIVLVALFAFVLRWIGPANYGVLVAAVSALVVVLFAILGVSPAQVVAARGLTTLAGGAIALTAYWLWPTWEQSHIGETLANMLDAYRQYFRDIKEGYLHAASTASYPLDASRISARLARSNLEAAVERMSAEPRVEPERFRLFASVLANSHRLVHALMALEAGLTRSQPEPARQAFHIFANDVELTLYYLASALRGSPLASHHLPDLREDHHQLAESGDPLTERHALVNTETDRVTNSLNTMAGEILQLAAS